MAPLIFLSLLSGKSVLPVLLELVYQVWFIKSVDIAASGQVKMRPLLTHKFYIDEVDKAFKLLMENKNHRKST